MLCQVTGAKCSLPGKKDQGAGFSVLAAREIERELFHLVSFAAVIRVVTRHATLLPALRDE